MISTIAPQVRISTANVARADCPAPQPPQTPALPVETVDFSSINTAVAAAQLPILEPSFQLSLAFGVMAAIMAGMGGGGIPLIEIGVETESGGSSVSANYAMDLKDEQNPLTVSGFAGAEELGGSFAIDEQNETISWNGRIGNNAENLTFSFDEQNQALKIDGQFGQVDAHLNMSMVGKDVEDFQGFVIQGTLGGEEYYARTDVKQIEEGEVGQDGGMKIGTMHTRGNLGSSVISKDYEATAYQMGSSIAVNIEGGGQNGGVEQVVNTTLTIVP